MCGRIWIALDVGSIKIVGGMINMSQIDVSMAQNVYIEHEMQFTTNLFALTGKMLRITTPSGRRLYVFCGPISIRSDSVDLEMFCEHMEQFAIVNSALIEMCGQHNKHD